MEENLSVSNAREIAGIDSGMGEIGNRQPLRGGVQPSATTPRGGAQLGASGTRTPPEGEHTRHAPTEPQKRSQPLPLRVGDRVRALASDGFVTEGMTGLVVNVIHPGYGGNQTRHPRARVLWDDDTSCMWPSNDLLCTSRSLVEPVANTVTALSPDTSGAA